jgi:hypothetical protein
MPTRLDPGDPVPASGIPRDGHLPPELPPQAHDSGHQVKDRQFAR